MKIINIVTLPVYRIERLEYYSQRELFVEDWIFGGVDGELKRKYAKEDPDWFAKFKAYLYKKYGGEWEFNEVVGYIELHLLSNQVYGSYWQDNKKRYVKSRETQFECISRKLVPEMIFSYRAKNEQIYQTILDYIAACQKQLRFCYVEQRNLTNVGGHVDWRGLIESL